MKKLLIVLMACVGLACSKKKELTPEELKTYEAELNSWHDERIEELKTPTGWLNLVGLYWLEPGINSFGSDEKNSIVFPKGKIAEQAGYFLLKDNVVSITVSPKATVKSKGVTVVNQIIFHPDSSKATMLESGSLRWNIIKRDTKYGIRLRDEDSPLVREFKGVERYPVDPALRLEAFFEKSDSAKTIDVTNAIGQTTPRRSPGTFVFSVNGNEYRLDALDGNKNELFIIFADATSGKETYGGGRFLYVKKADPDGKAIVDFNKAYNPPCVFTPYATCPLPPRQNVLPFEVKAGEKNYAEHKATASLTQ